jgi:hypothetical protein
VRAAARWHDGQIAYGSHARSARRADQQGTKGNSGERNGWQVCEGVRPPRTARQLAHRWPDAYTPRAAREQTFQNRRLGPDPDSYRRLPSRCGLLKRGHRPRIQAQAISNPFLSETRDRIEGNNGVRKGRPGDAAMLAPAAQDRRHGSSGVSCAYLKDLLMDWNVTLGWTLLSVVAGLMLGRAMAQTDASSVVTLTPADMKWRSTLSQNWMSR